MSRRALPAVLFLLLAAPRAFPAEIRVPRDFPTIQEALEAAAEGDTVLVAPGEHFISDSLRFNRPLDFPPVTRGLVLKSERGAQETVIRLAVPGLPGDDDDDDDGFEATPFPLVAFRGGETTPSVLEGFHLSGGLGVDVEAGASPLIKGCTISGSSSAGVTCREGSSPRIEGCLIAGNARGVICLEKSLARLVRCTISGNSADGGIACSRSSPELTRCTITANKVVGLSCDEGSSPAVTDCAIALNEGPGVACLARSSPRISSSTIAANLGAGLEADEDSRPSLMGCIAWRNLGGSVLAEEPDALEVSRSCLEGDAIWPGPGNINADPLFCGWRGGPEVFVDATSPGLGDGSRERPYAHLNFALDGASFDLALAPGSPCLGSGMGGASMGAQRGLCEGPPRPGRVVRLAPGEYPALLNLSLDVSLRGAGRDRTAVVGRVKGLRSGASLTGLEVRGGIELRGGQSPSVLDCKVSALEGDGISCGDSSPTIRGCLISGSRQSGVSAGPGSSLALLDCSITDNSRFGLDLEGGAEAEVSNCLIARNGQGGVRCEESSPSLTRSTVAQNGGAGLECRNASPALTGCIVWDNPMGLRLLGGSAPSAEFSCIQGQEVWPGPGNLNADPLFCAFGNGRDIHVDQAAEPPGDGNRGSPYPDLLGEALTFSLALSPGSPCLAGGEGGTRIGADTGSCAEPGRTRRRIILAAGSYVVPEPQRLRGVSIEGAADGRTELRGPILGLRTGSSLSRLTVTANQTLGAGVGVDIAPGEAPEIRHCVIQGGSVSPAVWCREGSTPLIEDSTLIAGQGTAALFTSSSATLNRCAIQGGPGGGVWFDGGSPTLTDCSIVGSGAGGVLCLGGSTPLLTRCRVQGTVAAGGGISAGVVCLSRTAPRLIDCVISQNLAAGVLCGADSLPTLEGTTIAENEGPGVVGEPGSSLVLTRCSIRSNSGSGMFLAGSAAVLTQCSITGNGATGNGGGGNPGCGLVLNGSSPTLTHCTIAGNRGFRDNLDQPGGMVLENGSFPTLASCIVWDNYREPIEADSTSALRASHSCIQGKEPWPGPGNIHQDPLLCGFAGRPEVHVDGSATGPGDGTRENPYTRIGAALEYAVGLAPGSPCRGTGEAGADMGADAGTCDGAPVTSRRIHLAPGTYSARDLNLFQRVSIQGAGAELTVIQGTVRGLRTGAVLSGVTVRGGGSVGIWIDEGEAPEITLCAVTGNTGAGLYCAPRSSPRVSLCSISNTLGPGVLCDSGSVPSLIGCQVTGNSGDGLHCLQGSSPRVEECSLAGNGATGIWCGVASTPRIVGCTIAGNAMDGVHAERLSRPDVAGCRIERNRRDGLFANIMSTSTLTGCILADNLRHGAYSRPISVMTLTDCEVSGNQSANLSFPTGAAGIHCADNTRVILEDCRVFDNRGGGVYCARESSVELAGCRVTRNSGSGVRCDRSSPTLTDCVITHNSATFGGGVYSGLASSPVLRGCTIAGNRAERGGGVHCAAGSTPVLADCILWDNTGGSISVEGNGAPRVSDSCVDGEPVWPGAGNLNRDPLFCGWGEAREVHVDAGRREPGDGSREAPFRTLAEALDGGRFSLALSPGSPCLASGEGGGRMGAGTGLCDGPAGPALLVRLAPGSYELSGRTLVHHVSIEGAGEGRSVIEGTVGGLRTGASLSRLTVTLGEAGGIVMDGGESPLLNRVTASGNFGPGVTCGPGASPTLADCSSIENSAPRGAGVLCRPGSAPRLARCFITGNSAGDGGGGGVYCDLDSRAVLTACTIAGNFADGVHSLSSETVLVNCLIAGNGNAAGSGGGLTAVLASPAVTSCTITGNFPRGVFLFQSSLLISNCIIAENQGPSIQSDRSSPVVVRSCVQGALPPPGEGNINLSPLFIRPGAFDLRSFVTVTSGGVTREVPNFIVDPGDYRLQAGSPALDAGGPEGAPATDIDGRGRPCGGGVDMGAYEAGDCQPQVHFRRGDLNADSRLNLSDAIASLGFLFLGGPDPGCHKAVDSNDDGRLTITDPVHLLLHLFQGKEKPPPPFESCGRDPTADGLGCVSQPACEGR